MSRGYIIPQKVDHSYSGFAANSTTSLVCFLTSTKYKNVQQNFIPQATAYCTLPPSQDIGFINVKYYQPELVEEASGRISYCGNLGA